jgi:hypothetical protein
MSDQPTAEPKKKRKPKGVVAMLISPDGTVMADVSHFERDRPGGFLEAQKHYAGDALANEVVRKFCSDFIYQAMRGYDCQQLLGRMRLKERGFRVEYVEIGHDDEDA